MIVVVDTNIVFSGILSLNGIISDFLLNSSDEFEFYSPSSITEELDNHHHKIIPDHHKITSGHQKITPGHNKMAPCHDKMTPDHDKMTPGHDKMAPDHDKMAPDHLIMTYDHQNMAYEHPKTAHKHQKMAHEHQNMAYHQYKIIYHNPGSGHMGWGDGPYQIRSLHIRYPQDSVLYYPIHPEHELWQRRDKNLAGIIQ